MNPSSSQVKQRRRQLRQERRVRALQSLWRFGCMAGILAGVGWVVLQPNWTVTKPEQIEIKGNRYLSEAAIRSMLAIQYPQPMIELSPEQLTNQLLKQGSLSSVRIDRRLLPPRLLLEVEDRPPVAQIINPDGTPQAFVDESGAQLPLASYLPAVRQKAPRLKVLPFDRSICPDWSQLYQIINRSPVMIGVIDCRNPQNSMLQTEVGKVRLGSLGDKQRLTSQIQQLDLLREWRQHTNLLDAEYLDLENPHAPKLKLKQSPPIPLDPPQQPR